MENASTCYVSKWSEKVEKKKLNEKLKKKIWGYLLLFVLNIKTMFGVFFKFKFLCFGFLKQAFESNG